ncbi:LuxR C-terminal-related transcriptional regulator [Nonomuraea sp. NPDC048892]|uniref:LuxR C-terminal-related transcriptional regulator n=1 Tax=Nonomuraea sp. NPDC048892 TaxID=3154624 RepID=UPI0033C1E550
MSSTWPFSGRGEQLARLRSSPAGAVVLGPAGAGKTRLVAEAVRDGRNVAWVRATTAAAELPLGAFAHLLPASPPSANLLRWASESITADVLVVDDAHALDPASAALVHFLAAQRAVRLFVTVRSGEQPPDAVVALWKDDLLPRLTLEALTREETAEVLAGALDGRVESGSLTRLWRLTRGNPLYLRELVLSGVLRDVGGLWLWHGPLLMSTTMRETIAARIGDLDPEERSALEHLALGEPLGADLLASLTSPAAVQGLEERQLVTVQADERRLAVRLAHPLYGEVIRASCGTLRTRTILHTLADAVSSSRLRRRDDMLRVAVWRLDAGDRADPSLLLRACGHARAVRDLPLAERLARAAGDSGEAWLALASILYLLDRYTEAAECYARAWSAPLSPTHRMECAAMSTLNLVWGLGRHDTSLLGEAMARTSDPGERQILRCFTASIGIYTGDLRTALAEVASAHRSPEPLGNAARGSVLITEAPLRTATGETARALECVAELMTLLEEEPQAKPSITGIVIDNGAMAAAMSGDLDHADRLAAMLASGEEYVGSWNRVSLQACVRRAQLLRLRGRLSDALVTGADALVRLPGVPTIYAGPCLGEIAYAHALRGDADAAESVLARATGLALSLGPLTDLPLESARIWTLAARGDVQGAIERALAVAESPYLMFTLFALHDVVRLGRPGLVADRLAALPVDGVLAPLFARHAAARTAGELLAVSESFARLGFLLYAAESAAQAAARFVESGEPRRATGAETYAWTLTRRCQGARTPALVGLSLPGLTPRQREIATLAAQGLTNREIASRLVLSVRTVANTLYAVYEKTGTPDRKALAEVLEYL